MSAVPPSPWTRENEGTGYPLTTHPADSGDTDVREPRTLPVQIMEMGRRSGVTGPCYPESRYSSCWVRFLQSCPSGTFSTVLALSSGLLVLPSELFFFIKARMCLQLRSRLSLFLASRTLGVQWSLVILHYFCSFQSKPVMFLLTLYSQRLCGPPLSLIGIYSIRQKSYAQIPS